MSVFRSDIPFLSNVRLYPWSTLTIKFTIKDSNIPGQNGSYELLTEFGLFRKEPDPGPCKPSVMYLINWIIKSDSGAVILINDITIPIIEDRRKEILLKMGISTLLLGSHSDSERSEHDS